MRTDIKLRSKGLAAILLCTAFVPNLCECQTAESPNNLVTFLTGPVPPALLNRYGVSNEEPGRAVATALASIGPAAIEALNAGLAVVERESELFKVKPTWKWLFFAYAKIQGPRACQRIRVLVENPRLRLFSYDLDQSLAIALDLTSYVSDSRVADNGFVCCRVEEPRHSLDRLILAWMQDNQRAVEQELGPNGRSALKSLLTSRSYLDFRSELWRGPRTSNFAIGFHLLNGPEDWSKPEETLDQELHERRRNVDLGKFPIAPNLLVQFVDRSGAGCGQRAISFAQLPLYPELRVRYVVDDQNLEGLLRTISACALR